MTTVRELILKLGDMSPDLDVHIRDQGTDHNLSVHLWVGHKSYVTIGVEK